MTTIAGVKVNEPYPAIVFGTDLQGSYKEEVLTGNGVHSRARKVYFKKMHQTTDDKIVVAGAGCHSPQYDNFVNSLVGAKSSMKRFDLIKELRSGTSDTVKELNLEAMTINPKFYDTKQCFNLGVVYRDDKHLEMYNVTETGLATKVDKLVMGSGQEDARQAYNVLSAVGNIPKEYDTELTKAIYKIMKIIEFATYNDTYSSGKDVMVITNQGIIDVSKMLEERTADFNLKAEKKVILEIGQMYKPVRKK